MQKQLLQPIPLSHPKSAAGWAAICTTLIVVFAAPCTGAWTQDQIQAIDSAVVRFVQSKQVPGLSVAIASENQILLEKGFGLADIENQVPATPRTVYRLASISKMLTSVAVLQLAEQGKLDLASPIQRYLPSFPVKEGTVNAELLLKHQSGIRHYRGDEIKSAKHYENVADSFPVFRDDPLLFAPGSRFSYTTYGFNVLGAVVEAAAGKEFVPYIQEKICYPAAMTTIQPDNPYKIIPHRAAGYRRVKAGTSFEIQNDDMVNVSNKIPGGGWCSNAGDLARFAIALMEGRLLRPETLARMWTPQRTINGQETNSGLGCFVQQGEFGQRISHSGGQPQVSTFLVFWPEKKIAIALMCNLSGIKLEPLAEEIVKRIPIQVQSQG